MIPHIFSSTAVRHCEEPEAHDSTHLFVDGSSSLRTEGEAILMRLLRADALAMTVRRTCVES
jgi:hypothetical protein